MAAGALKGERKKRENTKKKKKLTKKKERKEMGVDGPKRQTVAHQRREGMKNGRFVFFLFCSLFLSRPVCCFFVDFFSCRLVASFLLSFSDENTVPRQFFRNRFTSQR